jgi:hypothetical protein
MGNVNVTKEQLMSNSDSLDDRLRAIEDVAEITRLKTLYGEYWDAGWADAPGDGRGDGLAALFTEDGIWDGRPVVADVLHGREEIKRSCDEFARFNTYAPDGSPRDDEAMSIHFATNPRVDVDDDTAVGKFTGLLLTADAESGRSFWCCGRYIDEFVRTDDGWKFTKVKFHYAMFTPFDGAGWVKERFVGVEFTGDYSAS